MKRSCLKHRKRFSPAATEMSMVKDGIRTQRTQPSRSGARENSVIYKDDVVPEGEIAKAFSPTPLGAKATRTQRTQVFESCHHIPSTCTSAMSPQPRTHARETSNHASAASGVYYQVHSDLKEKT